jgi:hypothetical protein
MNWHGRWKRAGDLAVDRELVLLVLGGITLGPMLVRAGLQRSVPLQAPSACALERACWHQLWSPLLPPTIAFIALIGWAVIEPEEAEVLPLPLFVLAAPFVVVWMRAAVRAIWGVRRPREIETAATIGILRPRVVVAFEFLRCIDPDAGHAVKAHEAAHARHHDPFRVWAAQFATDLQWPGRGAARRFSHWRHALELARDEEIRRQGIEGADLAAAVIAALRFGHTKASPAVAIVGGHQRVSERIARLLAPLPEANNDVHTSNRLRMSAVAAPIAALMFGATFGEAIVRALVHTIP